MLLCNTTSVTPSDLLRYQLIPLVLDMLIACALRVLKERWQKDVFRCNLCTLKVLLELLDLVLADVARAILANVVLDRLIDIF